MTKLYSLHNKMRNHQMKPAVARQLSIYRKNKHARRILRKKLAPLDLSHDVCVPQTRKLQGTTSEHRFFHLRKNMTFSANKITLLPLWNKTQKSSARGHQSRLRRIFHPPKVGSISNPRTGKMHPKNTVTNRHTQNKNFTAKTNKNDCTERQQLWPKCYYPP